MIVEREVEIMLYGNDYKHVVTARFNDEQMAFIDRMCQIADCKPSSCMRILVDMLIRMERSKDGDD